MAAVIALAAVGALVGYLVGLWSHTDPRHVDKAATPLVAASPSAPIDPPVKVKPDNDDYPPLGVDLKYTDATLGSPPYQIGLKVPEDWEQHDIGPIEKRWTLVDDPDKTYGMRVTQIQTDHQTIAKRLESREKKLAAASDVRDFKVVLRTADSLRYTYVDRDGYLRFAIETWVSPFGTSEAEVEIAVTGRMVDEDGLDRLIDHVADRVVKAP